MFMISVNKEERRRTYGIRIVSCMSAEPRYADNFLGENREGKKRENKKDSQSYVSLWSMPPICTKRRFCRGALLWNLEESLKTLKALNDLNFTLQILAGEAILTHIIVIARKKEAGHWFHWQEITHSQRIAVNEFDELNELNSIQGWLVFYRNKKYTNGVHVKYKPLHVERFEPWSHQLWKM